MHLLRIPKNEISQVRTEMLNHKKDHMPGLVRISFGIYNTKEEVDVLIKALNAIAGGQYSKNYLQDKTSGEFYLNLQSRKPSEPAALPRGANL
jgi:CRISPR-associated protein Cas8b1/Cst1 subtype I-B